MAKYKLLSDELSRMAKVFKQFQEAQEIVDSLASAEQGLVELEKQKQSLAAEVEGLKKEKILAKEAVESLQEEAAKEAMEALKVLEEKKAQIITQSNAILEEAKVKAADLVGKAESKVKTMEAKEKMVEAQVAATVQVLAEKEDQLAQIESVLAKFKG